MLSTSPRPTSNPSINGMGNVQGRNWIQGGPSSQGPMATPTMPHQPGPINQNRSPQAPGMQPQPGQQIPIHNLGPQHQGQGPPRTVTTPLNTPHQLQNGVQGSPAMTNLGPQNVIGVQLANMPKPPIRQFPPFPALQFHQMHKAYLDRNGVPADRRQPSIQGIPIDLHILHLEMMKVGGLLNVGFSLFYLAFQVSCMLGSLWLRTIAP